MAAILLWLNRADAPRPRQRVRHRSSPSDQRRHRSRAVRETERERSISRHDATPTMGGPDARLSCCSGEERQRTVRACRTTIPSPAAGQVLIRVQACGVCHSDAITKLGAFPGIAYLRVPGHEVVGVIEKIGERVPDWK